jgi:hypothetical protein
MGISNYYFKNIEGVLVKDDYWDFHLSSDNQGQCLDYATKCQDSCSSNFDIVTDKLVVWFDTNNTGSTVDGSSIKSLVEWENYEIKPSSGFTLCDFGLTGVDNGRYDMLSGITVTITSADTKVILYPVTGYTIQEVTVTACTSAITTVISGITATTCVAYSSNTEYITSKGKYDYPWTFRTGTTTSEGCLVGDTICLNGGFYQGYFKLDFLEPTPERIEEENDICPGTTTTKIVEGDPDAMKYDLMPTEFEDGWTMETWIKWDNSYCDGCSIITGITSGSSTTTITCTGFTETSDVFVTPSYQLYASPNIATNGFGNAEVYDLYLTLVGDAISLHTLYGNSTNQLTGPSGVYQDPNIGVDVGGTNPAFWFVFPDSEYDSWLTIGVTDGTGGVSTTGLDFTSWNSGGALSATSVATGGLVYLDDPTTIYSGTVQVGRITVPSGSTFTVKMNAQGKSSDSTGDDWYQEDIEFTNGTPSTPQSPLPSGFVCKNPNTELNGDSLVNTTDRGQLLASFGNVGSGQTEDINRNDIVDVDDFQLQTRAWGFNPTSWTGSTHTITSGSSATTATTVCLSANTLNNTYTGNTGFFFYIGTRAENKFRNVFSGETGLYTCHGIPLSPDDNIEIDDGGQSWFTRSNLGLPSCWCPCPTGSTVVTGVTSGNTTGTTTQPYCDQLSENALGFRVTPDGKIGYRKMTVQVGCYNNKDRITGTTMEEGYSDGPVFFTGDTWNHVAVTYTAGSGIKNTLPSGTLKFWVNGRVVYRVKDFIGLQLRALDEWSDKQLGVPFNISWGGGTQGLLESQTFGGPDPADQGLDLETNFAGTFDGELSQLRFYEKPLNILEIRNNFFVDCNRYCKPEQYGGSVSIIPNYDGCDDCGRGNYKPWECP